VGESGRKAVVSLARGLRASDWRCHEVSVLPRGSCCAGAGTRAPTHLLGSPLCRCDFGAAVAGQFLAPSPISALAMFWG
jgi:hypothetical protein